MLQQGNAQVNSNLTVVFRAPNSWTAIPLNWFTPLQDGQIDVDGTTCNVGALNVVTKPHCFRNRTYNYGFKSKHPGGASFSDAEAQCAG